MTERATKNVIIQLKTDTWLRDYYFKCFKKPNEQKEDFDARVYEQGIQSLKIKGVTEMKQKGDCVEGGLK